MLYFPNPYDATAHLAYDQWREEYGKGDYDEVGFADFKKKYETLTVANVVAKKVERELKLLKNGNAVAASSLVTATEE